MKGRRRAKIRQYLERLRDFQLGRRKRNQKKELLRKLIKNVNGFK
ncbi:hypothetical protein [Peribacillus sp. SCS-155]